MIKNYFLKKLGLLLSAIFCVSGYAHSQCTNTTMYPLNAVQSILHDGTLRTITSAQYAQEYSVDSLVGAVTGDQYRFTSSVATDYLTLRDSAGNLLTSGLTPLNYTIGATIIRKVQLHVNKDASCATEATSRTTTGQLIIPYSFNSATTTQPSTAAVGQGSISNQVLRLDVSVVGNQGTVPAVTNLNFTLGTTSLPADITNVKVYYTGTSTTFATTTQFGTTVVSPTATFSVAGSQALQSGTNYFFVTFDVPCSAIVGDALDASLASFDVSGINYVPTIQNPAGTRVVASVYVPVYTSVGTTTVAEGSNNNQIIRVNATGSSACSGSGLGTIESLSFNLANGSASLVNISSAKVYYTTSTTFSTTTLYGTAVANPSGTFTFTGSQALASGSGNYFWLTYDVPCSAATTDSVNATATSITISGTAFNINGTLPTAKKITAPTTATTLADGNWNNPAIWSCGQVPNSSTIAITINNNITVNSIVDSSGSITVAAGKILTIASGSLTSGRSSAGTLAGNSNQLLTVNGTLTITGGILNMNGGISISSAGAFNMSGGTINLDPNDGTSAGSLANSNGGFYISSSLLNVTGGAINFLDPMYTATAGTGQSVLGYSVATTDAAFGTGCTLTFGGGDDTNPLNVNGFYVESNISTGTLEIGTGVVAGGRFAAQREVTSRQATTIYITKFKNLTVNPGSEIVLTAGSAPFSVTGNLVNNGIITNAAATTGSGLFFADLQYTTTVVLFPVTTSQTISGTGYFKKSTADADPTAATGNIVGGMSVYHATTSPGLTLNVPITATNFLRLVKGKVNTTATNFLSLGNGTALPGNTAVLTAANGTLYGFSATAYTTTATYDGGSVAGPFNRYFTASTTTGQQGIFPVGSDTSRPAQVLFTAAPTTGGYLTASWIEGNSISLINPTLSEPSVTPSTINKVTNAMWQITNAGTLTGGTYDAIFTNTQANGILDFVNTTLLKRATAATPWAIEGIHVASTGSNSSITVKRTGLTTFSQFAIGGGNTALPITLQYIKGQKAANGNALNWKVNCTSASITMELERSSDSRSFKTITSITAPQARCGQPFDYTDASPLKGTNYYRLKMIDVDGKVTYSPIVAIINGGSGAELVGIYPTVVRDEAFLSVAASRSTRMQINITDMSGRIIKTISQTVANGSSLININTAQLSTGVYNITGMLDGVQTKTLRFVKQ